MINRDQPIPLYHQLKTLIKEQIQTGALQPGDRLPTEESFCELYQISRAPVRHALTDLVQEGIIYRKPGVGTFVSRRAVKSPTYVRFFANDALWIALMEQAVEAWHAALRSPVALSIEVPAGDIFHYRLRTAAAQGEAPDIVSLDCVWLSGYAHQGYLRPLDALAPTWRQALEATLEPSIYRSQVIDGQLYGMPVQSDVTGLWYRRDWFASAGLEPPQTWDALREVLAYFDRAEIKRRYGHRYALALSGSSKAGEATVNTLFTLVWGAGGDLLDSQRRRVVAEPATFATLALLQELNTAGYLPPDGADFDCWEAARMLARGEVPMSFGGTYEYPVIQETSGWESEAIVLHHANFVALPRPGADDPPVASLGGTSWGITRQAEHPDTCIELMRLATSEDLITGYYARTPQISPFQALNQRLSAYHPWIAHTLPLIEVARFRPQMSQYRQVSKFLQQMVERILWERASIEETVVQTTQSIQLLLIE